MFQTGYYPPYSAQRQETKSLTIPEKRKQSTSTYAYEYCSSIGGTWHICRMMTEPSHPPDTNASLSEERRTCSTLPLCSVNAAMHDPSLVLHSRAVPSFDADATYLPHREKQARQLKSLLRVFR